MKTYRVYTDSEGESHFETIETDTMTSWFEGIPASEIKLMNYHVGQFLDWHAAPYRNFVILLTGTLEIGVTDGEKKMIGPGATRLMTDTGKGHTTRVIGNEPCTIAIVKLES